MNWPDAVIVATIPIQRKARATTVTEHPLLGSIIAALVGSERWAVVDAAGYFAAAATPKTCADAGGIHPTQPGCDLNSEQAGKIITTRSDQ